MTINPNDIQEALKGVNYPAEKQDLIKAAKNNNASEDVMSVLQNMPDQEYASAAEVNEQFAEVTI